MEGELGGPPADRKAVSYDRFTTPSFPFCMHIMRMLEEATMESHTANRSSPVWLVVRRALAMASGVLVLACRPVNTIPPPVAPDDPALGLELDIPRWLDVRSIEFDAAFFSEVKGSGNYTETDVGGRGFLTVHGVHRETGEQYLLLYDDVMKRSRPAHIIRFRPVDEISRRPTGLAPLADDERAGIPECRWAPTQCWTSTT